MFSWRWSSREAARKRYLSNQTICKACHADLANLFFADDAADDSEEKSPQEPGTPPAKETPFQSTLQSQDVTYTLRHVEEAWLHLLQAGDVEKLKKLAVCAFDFLLAAVQMVSVSYLRCVLEHDRRYLLERDLELVYYAIRNSSDVLTRDPLQLGAQLICWLRPVVEDGGDLVRNTKRYSGLINPFRHSESLQFFSDHFFLSVQSKSRAKIFHFPKIPQTINQILNFTSSDLDIHHFKFDKLEEFLPQIWFL